LLLAAGAIYYLYEGESGYVVLPFTYGGRAGFQINGEQVTLSDYRSRNKGGTSTDLGISLESTLKDYEAEVSATVFAPDHHKRKVKCIFSKCIRKFEQLVFSRMHTHHVTEDKPIFVLAFKFHFKWSALPEELSAHKTSQSLDSKVRLGHDYDAGPPIGKPPAVVGAISRLECTLSHKGQVLGTFDRSVPWF